MSASVTIKEYVHKPVEGLDVESRRRQYLRDGAHYCEIREEDDRWVLETIWFAGELGRLQPLKSGFSLEQHDHITPSGTLPDGTFE